MDAELRGKREELHLLRQNELNMELRVEAGHNHLVQLMKFLRTNQSDLDEVGLASSFVGSCCRIFGLCNDEATLLCDSVHCS